MGLLISGCSSKISVDRVDTQTAYAIQIRNALSSGEPSQASKTVLRRKGLRDRFDLNPVGVLAELHRTLNPREDIDQLFALSELSFLTGDRTGDRSHYLASAVYAWALLFPGDSGDRLPEADARLRLTYDLYNQAIAKALTTGAADGEIRLAPGTYKLPFGRLRLGLNPQGLQWGGYRLEHLVPTTTLAVDGLRNRYHKLGLGAPLAASLSRNAVQKVVGSERVGPNTKVPVTLIMRLDNPRQTLARGPIDGQLELFAADQTKAVEIEGGPRPLESDTTAALAYQIDQSPLYETELSGFMSGGVMKRFLGRANDSDGLFTFHPYRKGLIPIVLVHGTASSPARWAELINELEADPHIQERYQIWIFTYDSGNPIGISAGRLRTALTSAVQVFDPQGQDPALRNMVVIGHSQGGLLTKLTTIDSGDRFWKILSDKPLSELKLDNESRTLIQQTMFYTPLPFVKRVVFIATPHHGALLASGRIGAMAAKLVTLPFNLFGKAAEMVTKTGEERLVNHIRNPPTAVDNMNPDNPALRVLSSIPVPQQTPAHSIVAVDGNDPKESGDDGVVAYRSAHIDEAVSEKVVRWNHSCQAQPEVIEEVRRILLLHAGDAGTNRP
jgi:pimeloyl-ACP methyl ester carboxylesterase